MLKTKGLPDRKIAAGTVIDQAELDTSNLWEATGTALEPCDLIVFRGRLLEYFRKELQTCEEGVAVGYSSEC